MLSSEFVNLHYHDEYSLRDGLGTIDKLIPVLDSRGTKHCAITNHGSVGGWIKQYSACRKAGIKPIFGMEGYVNDYRGDDPVERKKHRSNFHLVLLARTDEGFYNLIKMHNDAQLNGFYYKPRINYEAMQKWGKGIIASSACIAGEIPQLLMADMYDEAKKAYERYASAFDEFYIEITLIEMTEQIEAANRLVAFAQDVGAPLIVTNDAHYIYPEHCETHDLLLLIKDHKTMLDKIENPEEVWQFTVKNLFYRSSDDMRDLFHNGFMIPSKKNPGTKVPAKYENGVFTSEVFEEAMANTVRVAESIENIELDSTLKLPKLYDNAESIMRDKARVGMKRRGLDGVPNYEKQLAHELDVICGMGFADYFLTMDKIISDAKQEYGEWAVGFGRGCFHPACRVVLADGTSKFISDVKKGDVVVSHDRSSQNVIDTFEYDADEELIEIETSDGRVIRCTLDHKILVSREGSDEWVEAQNLSEGDDIVEVV